MKKILAWVVVVLAIATIVAKAYIANKGEEVNEEVVDETTDIEKYVGSYQDEFSQRASADVELNADGETVKINVHWSDSAMSGVIWTMNAKLEDDKLVYEDGKKEYYEFINDTDPETYTTMDENQNGYFEIKEDKLYWLGSPEDDCKECIFSIPQY